MFGDGGWMFGLSAIWPRNGVTERLQKPRFMCPVNRNRLASAERFDLLSYCINKESFLAVSNISQIRTLSVERLGK